MKTNAFVISIFLALASGGCSSNLSRTHRGDVLDDKVTAQRVQAALNRAGPDFQKIQAQATDGAVVLSGTVSSSEMRSRAEEIARSIHRVNQLTDEVQVRP